MTALEFEEEIKRRLPSAIIEVESSGIATWINIRFENRFFTIEATPTEPDRGIGFTEIFDDTNPYMGHDEVFPTWEDLLAFLKAKL